MKDKFQLEYSLNVTPNILFTRLSTPGGLAEWFADDIRLNDNIFTFIWQESEQNAKLLQKKNNKYVRFKWLEDEDKESFFEFRINKDELTGDIALVITDFAEDNEKDDAIELWNAQIDELKLTLGIS
ncbi:MAG: START-like domain-containing protein [Bacteroidales bacterium]